MRLTRLGFCLGVASALLATAPSALSQSASSQQQRLTFSTSTTIVEVDVIVQDRQGEFVPGLTAEDLQLFEDGKPQKIDQFYMVTHERGGQAFPVTGDVDVAPEDRARRIFVVLFDEAHMDHEGLARAKVGAERFINDNLGPGDFGGVYYNSAMYNGRLTNSRAELVTAINNVRPGFENRQALLSTFREFPRIPGEIDAVRIADGSLEVVDRLAKQVCTDDPFNCQLNGGENQVENLIQQKARLYVRQARLLTSNTMSNLRYVVNRLARIPGRKTLVFLSEGFFVEDSRVELTNIAAEAARAGTVIYNIDSRGLVGSPSANSDVLRPEAGRSTAWDTGEDGPMILASATGGLRFKNIDDISRAFNLVVRDTSTYYVIGYQPDNPTMDGTYRKIEVKPTTSGLRVRSRQGYRAVALPPMEPIRSGGGGH
jgi:VWFA-related protein